MSEEPANPFAEQSAADQHPCFTWNPETWESYIEDVPVEARPQLKQSQVIPAYTRAQWFRQLEDPRPLLTHDGQQLNDTCEVFPLQKDPEA